MINYFSSFEKISQENFEKYLGYNNNLVQSLNNSTYLHKSSHWIKSWNEAFTDIREREGREFWVFHLHLLKDEISEHIGVLFLVKQKKMGVSFWYSAGKLFGSPGPVIKTGFEREFGNNLLIKLNEENKFFFADLAPCIEDWLMPNFAHNEIKTNGKKFYVEVSDYIDAPYVDLNKHILPISKKLNSNLGRLKRNFIRDGVDFKHTVHFDSDAKKYIDQLAIMHIQEWPRSIFSVDEGVYIKFFEKLSNVNDELKVRLDCLYLENNLAAIVFGLTIKTRYYYLAPTYNKQYEKYSPGSLLIQELLISLRKEGFHIFDFMNSLESYKLKWTSDVQKRHKYILYSNKLLSPNSVYFKVRLRFKLKIILLKFFQRIT
jgi:hypothetical protein